MSSTAATPLPPGRRAVLTVSVVCATMMMTIDSTIANVALPHMQGTMTATQDQISWVLTSYIVAIAIVTPLTSFIVDRLGQRTVLISAVAGFTLMSMLCGMAQSLEQMVVFRLLQGVFGAVIVPLSQSTVMDIYPREQQTRATALWGMGVMVGPIIGPSLGGYLTEYFDWRWVFFINLPFGVLACLGIQACLPPTERRPDRTFDMSGFAFLALGLGALQLLLDRGESQDWFTSPEIVAEAIVSALGFYMFAVHMLTTVRKPFLPREVFADRNFMLGCFFGLVTGLILYSTAAILPPLLIRLYGHSVLDAGLIMAPRGLGTMIAMLISSRIMSKIDARGAILFALLVSAASLHALTGISFNSDAEFFMIVGILQGLGVGFMFTSITNMAFMTLPRHLRTDAAALFSVGRNIGGSIGISVAVTMLSQLTQVAHARLGESLTAFSIHLPVETAKQLPGDAVAAGAAMLDAELTRQAALNAYIGVFQAIMWLTILCLPLILLLRKPEGQVAPDPEVESMAHLD